MGRRLRWLVLVLGLLAVVPALAACGDDGDSEETTTTTAEEESTDTTEEESSDTTEAEDEDADSGANGQVPTADVGDCITNQVANTSVSAFEVVSCDEPHTGELIHKFDLPDGEFPDQATIQAAIEAECLGSTFEDYVGTPYETSEIFITPVTPTQQTWDQADDREVLCFGTLEGGAELTGTIQGSGR